MDDKIPVEVLRMIALLASTISLSSGLPYTPTPNDVVLRAERFRAYIEKGE